MFHFPSKSVWQNLPLWLWKCFYFLSHLPLIVSRQCWELWPILSLYITHLFGFVLFSGNVQPIKKDLVLIRHEDQVVQMVILVHLNVIFKVSETLKQITNPCNLQWWKKTVVLFSAYGISFRPIKNYLCASSNFFSPTKHVLNPMGFFKLCFLFTYLFIHSFLFSLNFFLVLLHHHVHIIFYYLFCFGEIPMPPKALVPYCLSLSKLCVSVLLHM